MGRGPGFRRHERFLVENYFKKPVILYNKPRNAGGVLYEAERPTGGPCAAWTPGPRIGELIGGSERENRLDVP